MFRIPRQWFICYYVTSKKVARSRLDEGEDVLIFLILPGALDPGEYSGSQSNEYQKHAKKM
jgi:hypothetical protein